MLDHNNLKAALTRLVLMEHPDLPFRPRRSKCDPATAGQGANLKEARYGS